MPELISQKRFAGGVWTWRQTPGQLLLLVLLLTIPAQLASAGPVSSSIPVETKVPERPWKFIILHHTATESGDVASIDASHRQRTDSAGNHWLGIGYHFLIGNGNGLADGVVEATFRWREQLPGAHAGVETYNSYGLGVCLVGDFEQSLPTRAQLKATAQLVKELQKRFNIPDENVLRHGDIKGTACPGKKFPLETLLTANLEQDASHTPSQWLSNEQERQSQRLDNRGERRFRPATAQTMEGLKHVVSISRLGTSRALHRHTGN